MPVIHPPAPVTYQGMKGLIDKLIEENKKVLKHKDTNALLDNPLIVDSFYSSFGKAVCPNTLQTVVERYDTTFNVYWKQLDDAAEYRVELYKNINTSWYKLTDISVERNNGYASITDLVGDGYLFRVVAEDRNGEIIARSGGVVLGKDLAEE